MPVAPTSGFKLQALPEPYKVSPDIGTYNTAQTQQAFAGGLKNAQAALLAPAQTRSALQSYARQLAEDRNAQLLAEAQKARLAEQAQLEQAANIKFQQARTQGPAGVALGSYNFKIGDTTMEMPFVAGKEGGATALGGPLMNTSLNAYNRTGGVTVQPAGMRINPVTGRTEALLQKVRMGPWGPVPEGAPFPADEMLSAPTPAPTPTPASTPATSSPANAMVAPAPVAAPETKATTPPESFAAPQAQAEPPAVNTAWFTEAAPKDPRMRFLFNTPAFTFPGSKTAEEAVEKANKSGVPAVVPNPSAGMLLQRAEANASEIQNENRKLVADMAKDLQASQNTIATIGRTLKIGDKVTTFAKVPLIGNRLNEFRALFQPEFQSIEALSKIPALTQAKSFFGSRVTNFDLESLQEAMGNINMPPEVRKEAFAAMISGIQMATEYKRSALEFAKAYPNTPLSVFDSYYSEYLKHNPVYLGAPGQSGFAMNANRMTYEAYNALKNKGYENPNALIAENPELMTEDGKLNSSKLPSAGTPWPPSSSEPVVKPSIPETPVSSGVNTKAPTADEAKQWMMAWRTQNTKGTKEQMMAEFKKAWPNAQF